MLTHLKSLCELRHNMFKMLTRIYIKKKIANLKCLNFWISFREHASELQ